jgi:O-antigen/teichoic acid export membrane protein
MYGPGQLGFYALGITVVQVANILSQFGLDNGVVRYVAHYAAGKDVARVRGTIIQAVGVAFMFSVALSGLMFLSAGFLAEEVFDKPFLATMFRLFSLALPFFTLMSMALWATQGFQTVKYAVYVQQVIRPLINLGFIFVFYLLGVQILGAVAAYILSMAAGSVLALYYLVRIFPELLDRSIPAKFESRALFGASGPMIVANSAPYIIVWIAVSVLGIFETAQAVGVYDAASRTANLSTLVLFAFTGIFSPMISNLYRRGLLSDLSYLYKDVSRWAFASALAIFLLTALLAKDVMAIFGEGFISGWPVMVVIAAAQLFNSSLGPSARLLAMTGYQRIVMYATLGSAAAAAVLNLLFVPAFGILGAAVATALALILANVVNLFFVRRRFSFWPYSRQYAKPALAGLLASAVVYLAQQAFPVPSSIVALLVFAPLFLVIFSGLFLALGLSPSDRQLLLSFWSAIRATLRRES